MSQSGPFDSDDPTDMAAFFSGLMGSLGSLGAMAESTGDTWSGALQLATMVATEGRPEVNVDPLERMRMEQLCRVAELHVGEATGLELTRSGRPPEIVPLTRGQWSAEALSAYRTLFEQLSDSLSTMMKSQLDDIDPDEMSQLSELLPGISVPDNVDAGAMLAGLGQLMGPMMLTMMAGSTVGQLASRSFGCYDLPLPRTGDEHRLSVIAPNIDSFAHDWSLPPDDVRLWVCINELAHHAVLGVPHVRERLITLLSAHAASFRADPESIMGHLGGLDGRFDEDGFDDEADELDQLQRLLGSPELALGAMRSPEQTALLPAINAVVSLIEGYVDHIVDRAGGTLMGSFGQVTEALRRRRVEADSATRFVEKLFGLELTTDIIDRGRRFVGGIVEREGHDTLGLLWSDPINLPTPNEIEKFGLWLARVGVDSELPELDGDADVPDYPDV